MEREADARVIFMETGSTDPFFNLAFEEHVLMHRTAGDILLLWQNRNTVVIGRNQNTEAEIDRAFIEAHGISVVRRATGGGAVYHDLGNLNYSFITDAGDQPLHAMARFTAPVVAALTALGLDAEASGRNDILVSGRKVSGTAQRILRGRILHHGTLLFDSDPDMVAGALCADPEKFRAKGTKSVRSRVGNIRAFLKDDMTMESFIAHIKTALAGRGFVPGSVTAQEYEEICKLKAEKYDTWDWNYGASPQFDKRVRRRYAGGTLEVGVTVAHGMIADIAFYGDFLALADTAPVKAALIGCPFVRDAVAARLAPLPLPLYFGGIAQAEVLDAIFG